ncbi:unnamed protein product [Cladocopium goreaui]|uniref:Calcium-dependent protein kinase 28 n=1 Tax=Cladocopium goreaui TaxID=2562237 RepID=A0A9P1D781_9DINO|nr:unnamed protein product [Cladocopium goreaui]
MQFEQVIFGGFPRLCASWALGIGDRAALAGPSNAGKSLQIQLIAGEVPIQSGRIVFAPEIFRIAVLRSGWTFQETDQTVKEEVKSLSPVPRGLPGPSEARSSSLSALVVDVERLSALNEITDVEIEKCLAKFDLKPHDLLQELPPQKLIRLAMAKLMIWQPDVLLLDDVTEDLEDLEDPKVSDEACKWMEEFLLSAGLKILLVASHDRSFMDRVCNRVISIQENKTSVLEGNYGRAYLAGGDFLHFHSFSLWQPKSSGLRATQAACAFASLVVEDFCSRWEKGVDVEGVRRTYRIVDVGTGTGILSLIVAQQWHRRFGALSTKPELQLWAVDLDEPALRIARANFDACPWADRIHTLHSSFEDWTPAWDDPPMSFICNPPYDDDVVNRRAGTEAEELSRRRALERSFLPLEELCRGVKGQGCRSMWILWGNAEDAPVLRAAANTGWRAVRQVRFQRSVHRAQAFATVWQLTRDTDVKPEKCLEPETILWQKDDGTPSTAWWQLVGSLYYWHLRPKVRQLLAFITSDGRVTSGIQKSEIIHSHITYHMWDYTHIVHTYTVYT